MLYSRLGQYTIVWQMPAYDYPLENYYSSMVKTILNNLCYFISFVETAAGYNKSYMNSCYKFYDVETRWLQAVVILFSTLLAYIKFFIGY